ncbi:MAG TPA: hypothetical protein PKB10_04925, partial [Tepidisphaeraceae bacterium]|nr:hypothetical protein [Tepidisphaeraceae bacterium]
MGAGWRVVDTSFLGFIQSRDYLGSYLSDTDALRYAIFTILSMPIVLFMLFVSLCLGTLQKAKLRSEHIARVALYSSTPLLLGGFLSMLPVYVNDAEDYGSWYMLLIGEFPRRWNPVLALPILFAGILGTTLTLGIACRRYLQVRHAWGVALASGVVLSLVLSALVIALRYTFALPCDGDLIALVVWVCADVAIPQARARAGNSAPASRTGRRCW